jgi:hypothetical protein
MGNVQSENNISQNIPGEELREKKDERKEEVDSIVDNIAEIVLENGEPTIKEEPKEELKEDVNEEVKQDRQEDRQEEPKEEVKEGSKNRQEEPKESIEDFPNKPIIQTSKNRSLLPSLEELKTFDKTDFMTEKEKRRLKEDLSQLKKIIVFNSSKILKNGFYFCYKHISLDFNNFELLKDYTNKNTDYVITRDQIPLGIYTKETYDKFFYPWYDAVIQYNNKQHSSWDKIFKVEKIPEYGDFINLVE